MDTQYEAKPDPTAVSGDLTTVKTLPWVLSSSPVLHAWGHSEPGKKQSAFIKLCVLMTLWAADNIREMLCASSGQLRRDAR